MPQKEGGEQVLKGVEAVPEVNTPAGRLETLFEAAGCHRAIKNGPLILEMRFNEFPAIHISLGFPWKGLAQSSLALTQSDTKMGKKMLHFLIL